MASSDSQIDKPQRGRHERAELPDVNIINTGAQTERPSLSDHLTQILIDSSVSQIAINETSRKRPPKPDIKCSREVPL